MPIEDILQEAERFCNIGLEPWEEAEAMRAVYIHLIVDNITPRICKGDWRLEKELKLWEKIENKGLAIKIENGICLYLTPQGLQAHLWQLEDGDPIDYFRGPAGVKRLPDAKHPSADQNPTVLKALIDYARSQLTPR